MVEPSRTQLNSATSGSTILSYTDEIPESLVAVQMLSTLAVAKCLDWSDERVQQLIRSDELPIVILSGAVSGHVSELIVLVASFPSAQEPRKVVSV